MRVKSPITDSHQRRGIATLWVILTLPVLLLVLCLSIETARLWLLREQLRTSLESAALAVVDSHTELPNSNDNLPAREAGRAFAAANSVDAQAIDLDLNYDATALNQNVDCNGDIVIGAYVERNSGPVFSTRLQPGTGRDSGPNAVSLRRISTDGWQTVALPGRTYNNMVVVGTPNYDASTTPCVVRVSNVTTDRFDFFVQSVNTGAPVSEIPVHFLIVESGVYSAAVDGVTMEAATYSSTVTDRATNQWNGESRAYANSYTNPVVVGQVMSFNDPDWSVFWSRGNRSNNPANSQLWTGKHVGEDSDTTRANETVGYIVIESGSGSMNGLLFSAGLGPDTVRGMDNAPPFTYLLNNSPGAYAVASQSGMDGNNGSWAVLYGPDPVSVSELNIAVDEDQIANSERSHITENVAYIILSAPPAAIVRHRAEFPFLCNFGCGLVATELTSEVFAVFDSPRNQERLAPMPTEIDCE